MIGDTRLVGKHIVSAAAGVQTELTAAATVGPEPDRQPTQEEPTMRVIVDFDVCASTGSCMQICPEVFEVRSDGYLYILQENPGEELRSKVADAADLCPTGAITVED